MAERHRAAADVDPLRIEVQLLEEGEGDHREGLVDLPQVDVRRRQAGPREDAADGAHRRGGEPLRSLGGGAVGDDARERLAPQRGRVGGGGEHQGGGAVVDLAGVGGGHRAVLLEGGLEVRHLRQVDLERLLVALDAHRVALALRHLHRHDLACEGAVLGRLASAPVALGGEGVLLFAAEPVLGGADLGAVAHVQVVVDVPQAVEDHRVEELAVAEAQPVAGARQQVGRLAHALHAAGGDHLEVAAAQVVGAIHHRPHPRAAHLVEGDGAGGIGQPAPSAAWRAGAWPTPAVSTEPM